MEKTRPVFEKRLGLIRVAVFQNVNEGRTWHNVSLSRRYKEGDQWKDATTFNGLGDLAQVKVAVELAMAWIAQNENGAGTG